jgi:hypothetical protein
LVFFGQRADGGQVTSLDLDDGSPRERSSVVFDGDS